MGRNDFEAKDFSNTWDGTYKGIACQVGTYISFCINENTQKSDITLGLFLN